MFAIDTVAPLTREDLQSSGAILWHYVGTRSLRRRLHSIRYSDAPNSLVELHHQCRYNRYNRVILLHYRWLPVLQYRLCYINGDKRYYIIGESFITLNLINLITLSGVITLSVIITLSVVTLVYTPLESWSTDSWGVVPKPGECYGKNIHCLQCKCQFARSGQISEFNFHPSKCCRLHSAAQGLCPSLPPSHRHWVEDSYHSHETVGCQSPF